MRGSRPPVFIIGGPRSGTTLLRLMLSCHPAIVVAPECGFVLWLREKWGDWSRDQCSRKLGSFVADLFACRKFDTWGLVPGDLEAFLADRQPTDYRELVAGVYWAYAHSQGRSPRRWGDKNNFHVRFVEEIAAIFPDAQFLHIVRDGRDVACSYLALARRTFDTPYAPNLPTEIAGIAEDWAGNVRAAGRGLAKLGSRVQEIRFDRLVLETEATLGEVCGFLGEEFAEQMLEYPARTKELEPAALMSWKEKTLQPPRHEEIGRYKAELSTRDITTFEAIAGDLLDRYGFR